MVNGEACDEAVALARENPRLGVGLHLTLVMGRSTLPPAEIPGLVNARGEFSDNPVFSGFRYFASRGLRDPLRREIAAQLAKFRATGLPLDHVNGHLNMHLHPIVFGLLMECAEKSCIRRMRLTNDSFWLNACLASGQWLYRASHAIIFRLLSWRARGELARRGIRHTVRVFGLLQNARVDEEFTARLLSPLPAGDSELYSHPSLDEFKSELDALISSRVKALVSHQRIQLIRYQDL